MYIRALQLASRFALPPNSLGYCGKDTAPEKFKSCIIEGNCKDVTEEIEKFIVLNPYLDFFSKITGKNKYSLSVVEAYWLGNDMLKLVKQRDYLLLLEMFSKQGVPSWLINELKNKKPKKFIPTHLFQVLHVGVGKASGSVPYNMDAINNCMVRWGKVEKIGIKNLTVTLNSLKKDQDKYSLTTSRNSFPYLPSILPNLSVESVVAIHWKQVVKIINKEEEENLKLWTDKVLASMY